MSQEKLLKAFIESTTTYKIEVSDNSMLPTELKDNEFIEFIVKPPVLSVLANCAIPMQKMPKDLLNPEKEIDFAIAVNYVQEMAEIFSILAHGKVSKYPDWYPAFVINNVTPKELFYLFQEVAMKTQSSFFLSSFQIAGVTNPMNLI